MEENSFNDKSNYLCSLEELVKKSIIKQTTSDKVR